jgi:hypothetical protein
VNDARAKNDRRGADKSSLRPSRLPILGFSR